MVKLLFIKQLGFDLKTTVVHFQKEYFDVYIGRPSKWGNPFSHKNDTIAKFKVATKEEAIEKYQHWLLYGDGKTLLDDLPELEGKILGCWCNPKKCHGDFLASLVNERFKAPSNILF